MVNKQIILILLIITVLLTSCLSNVEETHTINEKPINNEESNSQEIQNEEVELNNRTINFLPGNYVNSGSNSVLKNTNIEGVLLSMRWRNIETSKGKYNWNKLDKKIELIEKTGKKVVLNIMTSGVNVPDWLLENKDVETFSFIGKNKNQPIYGKTLKIPVYWDEKYLYEKQKFINELGKRYVNNPAVVGVMVSFVGTINNDWYIPKNQELIDKGYSTEKMIEIGKITIDMWAQAFPKQALKLPIGKSIQDGDNTITTLAETITKYGYSKYPNRFYIQINALSTIIPKANDTLVQNAQKDNIIYLLKLLAQHPKKIGFQMISSVTNDPNRVDKARLCPSRNTDCILNKVLEIALSYKPYFIEYMSEDIENHEIQNILESSNKILKKVNNKETNNKEILKEEVEENNTTLNFLPGNYNNSKNQIFFDFHYKLQKKNPNLYSDHNLIDSVILIVPWTEIEQKEGEFNFKNLDEVIDLWYNSGKHVVLRVIPYGQTRGNDVTPPWVYNSVSAIRFSSTKRGEVIIPKVWEPAFISIYSKYIEALGKHYNFDNRVEYIEVGIGHIGYTTAQPSSEGSKAFLQAGWSIDKWESYIQKVLKIYRDNFPDKKLILTISPILLRNYYLKDNLDFGEKIINYAAKKNYLFLFKGISENEEEFQNTGFIPLIQYLVNLDGIYTSIGFGDDWPLIGKTGGSYRSEEDFEKILSNVLYIKNNIIKRKFPIFLVVLDNELSVTYKKSPNFNSDAYEALVRFKESNNQEIQNE